MHKAMYVVVEVRHHVIHSERRCDDAVHNQVFFLRNYGVQTLTRHNLYCRDPLLTGYGHDAVTGIHVPSIRETQEHTPVPTCP